MSLRRALFVFLLLAGAAPAGFASAQDEQGEESDAKLGWAELLERDRVVSFSSLTVASALDELALEDVNPRQRSLAMMALGCARAIAERPQLESWASEGSTRLRATAILALGEMGALDAAALIRIAEREAPELAECALLALARSGDRTGVAFVERVAADASSPNAAAARDLLAFARDPATSRPSRAASLLLELRFAAARRHGLVRGQSWRALRLDELCRDEAFLDRVIFRSASEVRRPGIRDHYLELVCASAGDGARDSSTSAREEALRGAVNAMPGELSQMLEADLWQPSDAGEWSALLDEIDRRRLEGQTDVILRRALDLPAQRGLAILLLVRAGNRDALALLEARASGDDSRELERVAEELGGSGLATYASTLRGMGASTNPRVVAAALVAQMRLGSRSARQHVDERLALEVDPGRAALLEMLCRSARDPIVLEYLIQLWPRLEGDGATRVATALAGAGRSEARAAVRDSLSRRPPSGAEGLERIASLEKDPSLDDLGVMRALFPREGELEVNAALARVLVRAKDSMALPVVRAALWRKPWNRSVLAGALFAQIAGIDALRLELSSPPRTASETDLRRAGFALGEWGGLEQVEALDAKSGAGDPRLQGALLGALSTRTH